MWSWSLNGVSIDIFKAHQISKCKMKPKSASVHIVLKKRKEKRDIRKNKMIYDDRLKLWQIPFTFNMPKNWFIVCKHK